jgi:hypothetical protein
MRDPARWCAVGRKGALPVLAPDPVLRRGGRRRPLLPQLRGRDAGAETVDGGPDAERRRRSAVEIE